MSHPFALEILAGVKLKLDLLRHGDTKRIGSNIN